MRKFEKEIKILNIDKEKLIECLEENNATKIEESIQKIYVYDLPSIYARFNDCYSQLKACKRDYDYEICRNKLLHILSEVDNLTSEKEQKELESHIFSKQLVYVLKRTRNEELLNFLSNAVVINTVKQYGINPNKWIRLRETNGRTTVTIKHILNPNIQDAQKNMIQNVMEVEMEVPSIEAANIILEQLGFAFRNYQEKYRVTYIFNGVEIDIDSWPLIPTYVEIENDSEDRIKETLLQLKLQDYEIVSCNTAEVYKKYGIDLYQFRELKF